MRKISERKGVKNMRKTIVLSAVVAILVLAVAAVPVDAKVKVSNKNTGAKSTNKNYVDVTNTTKTDVDQDAWIFNGVLAVSNSGKNKANGNTGGGTVEAGKATTDVTLTNEANKDTNVTVTECGCETDVTATNKDTGFDSYNKNDVDVTNKTVTNVSNSAHVMNLVGAVSNSGGNSANWNTGEGSVTTGEAKSTVTITNNLNEGT